MRIAIFDYKVVPTNPIGSCHLRMIQGLCNEHDFVVFAAEFDNPDPQRIRFVRVPVSTRPLVLLFVMFHLLAPLYYWAYLIRVRKRFDLVQFVESNSLPGGDLSYAHFCHRRFLKSHWPAVRGKGLRSVARFLDHWFHSLVEPFVFRRAREIVVPSRGLARELQAEYPCTAGKVTILANPVNLDRMRRPGEFDRAAARDQIGFEPDDVVIVFVALGHFERKGLPLLMEAIATPAARKSRLKLNVVGGERDLIGTYRAKAATMGIEDRVLFSGMQKDVRPHFWAADAFALPSVYEVFPLVVLEAAAAGMPVIVSPLNGVEEFAQDGENCLIVERSVEGVKKGIERFLALSDDERRRIGENARQSARQYGVEEFQNRWREVYQRLAADAPARSPGQTPAAVV